MPIVAVKELAKSFGAQDVFTGINVQIDKGERIALVGPNGEGKSTLLRIIARLESPSAGLVTRARSLRIGYLPQQPPSSSGKTLYETMLAVFAHLSDQQVYLNGLEQAMARQETNEEDLERYGRLQQEFELAGGYTYELEIRRVLTGVGFLPEEFRLPLEFLSGGQRTRGLLAELLLAKPDLLLLDEPTNHLDLSATEWLENYLLDQDGSQVIVAHDRYFLDRVVHKVWDLAFGSLEVYKGNYSRYVALRAERLERRRAEYDSQQAMIASAEAFVRRYKAGQRAREARGRLKKLSHIVRRDRPQVHKTMSLDLQSNGRSGDLVLRTTGLSIGFGVTRTSPDNGKASNSSKRLFDCPELVLLRSERAALLGPNGSGKTTFLRTILGQLPPLSGTVRLGKSVDVGYFSQTHEGLNNANSPLDEILGVKTIPISRARDFLSRFLFQGDEVFKPLAQMSGGERSRVALAKLTLAGANFLILDEPTNHLDIASREILEEVLLDFDGTILFVSHDRYLVDALATQVWVLGDHHLHVYQGGYSDYLVQRERKELEQQGDQRIQRSHAKIDEERLQARRRQQTLRKQTKKASEMENRIEELELRLLDLSARLSVASQEQRLDDVREFGIEYSRLEAEREELLARWIEMSSVET
jgi:ATP-binding cassette subfamily F protein 3